MPATAEVARLDDATVAALLPRRDPRGHKGDNGRLVCLCGSLDYVGAALLCALAGVRAGAGLVVLAVPSSLQPLVAGRVAEAVTMGLPEISAGEGGPSGGVAGEGRPARGAPQIDVEAALGTILEGRVEALVCGPGLREGRDTAALLTLLLGRAAATPVVLDGGALNLLSRSGEWWRGLRAPAVLTPHPGEFARLSGSAVGDDDVERAQRCREAARRFGAVVVLKGANTVIGAPDGRLAVAPFANAALATAGTGDVLAGTIGALLAQGVAAFDAARAGVYLHAAAAAQLSERLGDAGLAASDLPFEIALARARLARGQAGVGRVGFAHR